MRFFGRMFWRGLAAILPLGLTIYLLYWLGTRAEALLAPVLKGVLPDALYFTGLGVIAGLLAVFVIGALMTTVLARWLLSLGERIVSVVPMVKTVYGALKDTMALFSGDDRRQLNQVVLVRVGALDAWVLGFLTRNDVADVVPDGADHVAVYLPLAYQIGGFTVMVPRASIQAIEMSTEDALRFAVTAGMSGPEPSPRHRRAPGPSSARP